MVLNMNMLTQWSEVLLENLIVVPLVNRFSAIWNMQIRSVFKRAGHGSNPEPDESGPLLPTLFY
jgi:hypothetical protein